MGDYGAETITFYSVPVLPPATNGIIRIFRITNIRVPVPGGALTSQLSAFLSTNPNVVLPVSASSVTLGVVGPEMRAAVNPSPAGGGNPFNNCAPVPTPTLASSITFTEGFATSFHTRVVPGGASLGSPGAGNTMWAGQALNLAAPANQNIPGGLYGGYATNNESGLILPGLSYTDPDSNRTYTAGLADFGTRLKAVFINIPAGVTVYVSTTSTGTVAVPGGTSVTPYAVLVAAGQSTETADDGANFTPLTSATTGSDGLSVYPLAPDNTGMAAAIWEVVNSNPGAIEALTFHVYIAYTSTFGTRLNPTFAALSYAPEPGDGLFTTVNATQGVENPLPRFAVLQQQGGPFAAIDTCSIIVRATGTLDFQYSIGGSIPLPFVLEVDTNPVNLAVTVTPTVSTPPGGNWLSAALSGGQLTISANPTGLAASTTPYTGSVQLSGANGQTVTLPVNLAVYPAAEYTVASNHTGDFAQGQNGATYTVVVSNASPSVPATGPVTVTESLSSGLSLVSMSGTNWNCNTIPTCTRGDGLDGGASYDPITVTVNVASNATSPQSNTPGVTVPGFLSVVTLDTTGVTSQSCDVKQVGSFTIGDLQSVINQALGIDPAENDLTRDGDITVADVQVVLKSVLTKVCFI